MRLEKLDRETGAFTFRFQVGERRLFTQLLGEFPLQQGAQKRISESSLDEELIEKQHFLEECLDEHRAGLRKQLDSFLATEGRLGRDQRGWKLVLDAEGIDWLLQILNDIRVGSWVNLGKPDLELGLNLKEPTVEHLHSISAMQLCAIWQSNLLDALEQGDQSRSG